MIYSASEAVQLMVLVVCFVLALARGLRERNAPWLSVVCFFACMLLGNVYWYGYMVVFGDTPHYSYISELSWIAGYLFLLMLLVECNRDRSPVAPVLSAWIPVVVCAACCVFYIVTSGNLLLNLVDNGLVAGLGFFAVRGLTANYDGGQGKGFTSNKPLHAAVLVFVIVEQCLWMSSLIPDSGPDFIIYSFSNFALTLSYISILACSWRSKDL